MILVALACETPTASEPCDACGGACVEDSLPAVSAGHVEGDVEYAQSPPSSGDHDPCWAPWGVSTEEVPPENWVHNLEHGGVVFLYDCPEGCAEDVAALESFVTALPAGRAFMTAYTGMDASFAAVAWEHRLLLGCLDTSALRAFYAANVARGPEDVTSQPAASCWPSDTGDTGT